MADDESFKRKKGPKRGGEEGAPDPTSPGPGHNDAAGRAIAAMAGHRAAIEKSAEAVTTSYAKLADEVSTAVGRMDAEVSGEIVARGIADGLLPRTETRTVVGALLAYATRGLPMVAASTASKLRAIIEYSILDGTSIEALVRRHGGLWAVYRAAKKPASSKPEPSDDRVADIRIVSAIPADWVRRVREGRSELRLAPTEKGFEVREVIVLPQNASEQSAADGASDSMPAPVPPGGAFEQGETSADDVDRSPQVRPEDEVEQADFVGNQESSEVSIEADAVVALGLRSDALRPNGAGDADMPIAPIQQPDLLGAAPPVAAPGQRTADDPDAATAKQTSTDTDLAAAEVRFKGRTVTTRHLVKSLEKCDLNELNRCADMTKRSIRGGGEKWVLAIHTVTPTLVRILEKLEFHFVSEGDLVPQVQGPRRA